MPRAFLTVAEFAAYMRLSKSTVYAMLDAGKVRSIGTGMSGRKKLIPVAEVERITGESFQPNGENVNENVNDG